jgi:asparagine synthase (glutamine-hydrolysing)
VEYLFSLGPEYKIRDGLTKYTLRKSMKGVLPEEVRTRRDKMGFVTPLDKWLKTVLKDQAYEIFTSKEFSGRPYFNKEIVLNKFNAFLNGKDKNSHYAIWSWLNLELWFRRFIDKDDIKIPEGDFEKVKV